MATVRFVVLEAVAVNSSSPPSFSLSRQQPYWLLCADLIVLLNFTPSCVCVCVRVPLSGGGFCYSAVKKNARE